MGTNSSWSRRGLLVLLVGAGALLAAPATAAPGQSISAHMTNNSVYLNANTYVAGSVSPTGLTGRVVVQRGVGGHWSDRQGGNVAADGSFKVLIRPSQAGIYALRARSNGGSVNSNTVYLRVKSPPCNHAAIVAAIAAEGEHNVEAVGEPICGGAWAASGVTLLPEMDDATSFWHWNGSAWVPGDCSASGVPAAVHYQGCEVS